MNIEYYKTYTIFYKFPTSNIVYVGDAWASVNDDMEVMWTLTHDDTTIIPNNYVFKINKKYEN